MPTIAPQLNFDDIASRLSTITETSVLPSELESFAQPRGDFRNPIEIVTGKLIGWSKLYENRVYAAVFSLVLPQGSIRAERYSESVAPNDIVLNALNGLVHLADNPTERTISNGTMYSNKWLS